MQTYGQTKNIVTANRDLTTGGSLFHTFDLNQPVPPFYGMLESNPISVTGMIGSISADHNMEYRTGDYVITVYSEPIADGKGLDMVSVRFQGTEIYNRPLTRAVPTDLQFTVYTMRELLDDCIKETNQKLQESDMYPEISYHPIILRVFQAGSPPVPENGRGIPEKLYLPHFANLLQEYMSSNDCAYIKHEVYRSNNIQAGDSKYTIVALFHPRPKHLTGMTYLDLFFDTLNQIDTRDEERAHRDGTWGTQSQFTRLNEGIARSGIHYMIHNLQCKDDVIQDYTTMRELRETTKNILDKMRMFPTIGFVVEHDIERTDDRNAAVVRLHQKILDRIESDFSRMFRTTTIE